MKVYNGKIAGNQDTIKSSHILSVFSYKPFREHGSGRESRAQTLTRAFDHIKRCDRPPLASGLARNRSVDRRRKFAANERNFRKSFHLFGNLLLDENHLDPSKNIRPRSLRHHQYFTLSLPTRLGGPRGTLLAEAVLNLSGSA